MQLKRTDEADGRRSLLNSFEKIDALISRSCVIYAVEGEPLWTRVCFWTRTSVRSAVTGRTRSCPLKWTKRQTRTRGGKSSFLCLPLLRPSWTRDRWRWWVRRDQTLKQTCFGLTPILLLNLPSFGTQESLNLLSLVDSYISSLSRLKNLVFLVAGASWGVGVGGSVDRWGCATLGLFQTFPP